MGFFDSVFGSKKETTTPTSKDGLNWKMLNSEAGLQEIIDGSTEKPKVIFKHSTSCPISSMAKNRLERAWDLKEEETDIYYLDLLRYRPISNKIESVFGVQHQSPQVLVIKNGVVIFDTSHNAISVDAIREAL